MIKVRIPSAESYKISTRPAAYASLKQALDYFHLLKQGQKIYFNGEAEVSKLIGGEFDNNRGSDIQTDVGYDDKIFIEFEVGESEYNDGLDSADFDAQTVPTMWTDPQTGSWIRPVFSGRKCEVTVNKFFKDRVQAQRYQHEIRDKLNQKVFNTLFDVQTHYPLTVDILECFQEIYNRLNNVGEIAPEHSNFIKWFCAKSEVPYDFISNIIGNNTVFAFKQESSENGLNYGVVNIAAVNKGAYIGKYEVSWSYSFYWNIHTHWDLCFPIQVWQQPMPHEYLPDLFVNTKYEYASRMFMESKLASQIFDYRKSSPIQYHALPSQDNWRPPVTSWVSPQLQVLVCMEDVPGEQVILNIKEIHGFTWNQEILDWIMKFRTKVTRRRANPLQFKLYSNEVEVKNDQLELRENGDLVLLRPATLGNIYRLTFNLDYALRLYDDECRDDLVNNPDWCEWIIGILFPNYKPQPGFGDDGVWDWWEIHNEIDVGDGEEVDFFERGTIGALIIAHNRDESNTRIWY